MVARAKPVVVPELAAPADGLGAVETVDGLVQWDRFDHGDVGGLVPLAENKLNQKPAEPKMLDQLRAREEGQRVGRDGKVVA